VPTKTRLCYVVTILLLLVGGSRAQATKILDLWRSPFGFGWSVSQDDLRHACWVASGGSVLRVQTDGKILCQVNGFWTPESISTNSFDGSVWVADTYDGRVVHLDINGNMLLSKSFGHPASVSVNTSDNSVWVADMDPLVNAVIHLDANGNELHRIAAPNFVVAVPVCVSVNNTISPTERGSVWVAELGTWDPLLGRYIGSAVSHYRYDPFPGVLRQLSRATNYNGPCSVSADAASNSCWVADTFNSQVVLLSAGGSELLRLNGSDIPGNGADFVRPQAVSADRMHSSVWIADTDNYDVNGGKCRVIQVSTGGSLRSVSTGMLYPRSVSALYTSTGGSTSGCWVADSEACEIVLLDQIGREQVRTGWLYQPLSVACDPQEGDVWVADGGQLEEPIGGVFPHAGVVKIDDAGKIIWRNENFVEPVSVSIRPSELISWVADYWGGEVVKLGITGGVAMRLPPSGDPRFLGPTSVSVSEKDGSIWFATEDGDTGKVFHYNASGSPIASPRTDLIWPYAVAAGVSDTDTSGWVGPDEEVAHLASDLTDLPGQRGGNFDYPWGFSVSSADDSCWVADGEDVVHLASDHTQLTRTHGFNVGFNEAVSVSVNSVDGTCWVADWGDLQWYTGDVTLPPGVMDGTIVHQVLLLDPFGNVICRGHTYFYPSGVAASEKDGTAWVADSMNGQIVHIVAADFADVLPYYWAYRYIGGCAHAGIVNGYPDGTYRPELPVARDAMAVYIARALAGGDDKVPSAEQYPTPSFTDVPSTYWAYRYIEYAKASGVVGGFPEGNYQPLLTVDRSSMAVFVARAMAGGDANVPPGPGTATFADVPTTYWAYRYIEYCHDQGVVSGYPDGYHPTETVTRAQMAVYIARAFDLAMPR